MNENRDGGVMILEEPMEIAGVPNADIPSLSDRFKNFKISKLAASKVSADGKSSGRMDGVIMSPRKGIRLGLGVGKHKAVENFFKDDEEIYQMFEGAYEYTD